MNTGKKFTIRPELEVNLSQWDIDIIMCTALEGGINHWCSEAAVVGDYLGVCDHEQISRGGILRLRDCKGGQAYDLTLENFLKGLKLYFERCCHVRMGGNAIDAGDIDANDADRIIQFALFGKVVYG